MLLFSTCKKKKFLMTWVGMGVDACHILRECLLEELTFMFNTSAHFTLVWAMTIFSNVTVFEESGINSPIIARTGNKTVF